jgi:hypothetical protein
MEKGKKKGSRIKKEQDLFYASAAGATGSLE